MICSHWRLSWECSSCLSCDCGYLVKEWPSEWWRLPVCSRRACCSIPTSWWRSSSNETSPAGKDNSCTNLLPQYRVDETWNASRCLQFYTNFWLKACWCPTLRDFFLVLADSWDKNYPWCIVNMEDWCAFWDMVNCMEGCSLQNFRTTTVYIQKETEQVENKPCRNTCLGAYLAVEETENQCHEEALQFKEQIFGVDCDWV